MADLDKETRVGFIRNTYWTGCNMCEALNLILNSTPKKKRKKENLAAFHSGCIGFSCAGKQVRTSHCFQVTTPHCFQPVFF